MDSFLPLCRKDADALGWDCPDFVYVTGDAYVDHPSFGVAIISRVLENAGYRVAILSQPDFKSAESFKIYGKPRLGFLVTGGNIDSMVAHYTVAKQKRDTDLYSPGGQTGKRPDRAVIVYCNKIREAYSDTAIIIGGLEASLRRFAHYDYWDDKLRHSILVDSGADLLTYGMGENILLRIAALLDKGVPIKKIRDVRGTAYMAKKGDSLHYDCAGTFDFDEMCADKRLYAKAFALQYAENDHVKGRCVCETYGDRLLVQNPPMPPLERKELDKVYELPFTGTYHPSYKKLGGVPAASEIEFSITHNRGCFGGCNFCAIAFHQGRSVRSRSIESVVKETEKLTKRTDFKGYIHDVGGPTANFRHPSCEAQLEHGICTNKKCLFPKPCKNLTVDHSEYVALLKRVEGVKGVKKVFIRSGIRYDYLLQDKDDTFMRKLVKDHVSGQLRVAPEHCCDNVLKYMGKPEIKVFDDFVSRFNKLSAEYGKKQYTVPYLMSSHPGSRLKDAVELAVYLKKNRIRPEQVQDFYPTPGTASTVMYYTGINPFTGNMVNVVRDSHEKKLQRALLQWYLPQNANLVREALIKAKRPDLIGNGADCLVKAEIKTHDRTKSNFSASKKAGTHTVPRKSNSLKSRGNSKKSSFKSNKKR